MFFFPIFLEKKLKEGNRDLYLAQKEETLYDIAQANAVQLSYLLEYNPGIKQNDNIKTGAKIRLRASAARVDEASTNLPEHMHQVQPKESLYAISKKYNVSVEEIKEWNNLTSDELKVGQQLIISK